MKPENGKRYNTRGGEVVGPMNVPPIGKWRGNVIADWDDHGWCEGGKFRTDGKTDSRDLISENHEPADTAPIDMSQNRVPWGLLTEAERDAFNEFSGYREYFDGKRGVWVGFGLFTARPDRVYRTVDPPVITSVTYPLRASGHHFTVTLTLQDGKPISGTVAV